MASRRNPDRSDCALLVDGDNVSPEILAPLLALLEDDGSVTERRVFRNWRSRKSAKEWDDASKRLAFERIDRYSTRRGKNAADVALVVDGMDLLHDGFRRFCIASGDTDFVPLIERLRRAGSHVTVVGHKADGGLLAEVSDRYMGAKQVPGVGGGRGRGGGSGGRGGDRPARSGGADNGRRPAKKSGGRQPAKQGGGGGRRPAKQTGCGRGQRPAKSGGQGGGKDRQKGPDPSQLGRLRSVLQSAFDACEAEGRTEDEGWLRVDILGKMVRAKDGSFSPQKYGLPVKTSLSDVLKRFDQWEVRREMRGDRPQYKVRRKD